jgi:hypothetical protein
MHRQILLAAALSLLAACDSESDAAMLDAMAFIVSGIEEGKTMKGSIEPIQRAINQSQIEYTDVANNPYLDPNLADVARDDPIIQESKTRGSKFVKYAVRPSFPEACLFRADELESFSKGESSNDFSSGLTRHRVWDLDLKKAFRFEVETHDGTPIYANIIIEGRGMRCADGKCTDKATFLIDGYDSPENRDLISRRERAISFVQKTCPGKPY